MSMSWSELIRVGRFQNILLPDGPGQVKLLDKWIYPQLSSKFYMICFKRMSNFVSQMNFEKREKNVLICQALVGMSWPCNDMTQFWLMPHIYRLWARWWCHMATKIWFNVCSGNGLIPVGTKPLPKPMLTYDQNVLWFSPGSNCTPSAHKLVGWVA